MQPLQATGDGIWDRVRSRLRSELGEEVYSSWFARAELESFGGGLVHLSVPTRFLKSWIASHYQDRLIALLRVELGEVHRLEISVRTPALARAPAPEPPARFEVVSGSGGGLPAGQPALGEAQGESAAEGEPYALIGSPLDPRFTFETYRLGRANALAAAAARRVIEGDGLAFNPLYVHASVGLGKTHLLQAIAWQAQMGPRPRRFIYLTAERFVYRFVAALKANAALAFKDQLRGIDVLLIDDMQFLQGRATQTEFCHLLNALIDASRQVVVAADRPPSDLESLDERVRSRLAGGLVAEISPPDEQMRCEILEAKAALARTRCAGLDIPDEVLRYVAHNVAGNGRDLDGAFTRLLAHNQLTGAPISVELAERTIRDLVCQAEPKRVRIEDIQRVVAKHYNVSRSDLVSSRRTRTIVKPRQIAMYLAKVMTPRSLPEIGRRFGGRDHTTVLHAVRKVEELLRADQMLLDEIEALKRAVEV
jgi:chromosomal replication initiator protein